jgi:hypothetical protein
MVTEGWGSMISPEVIKLLEEDKAYLQHNPIGGIPMIDLKWYWNKDTNYTSTIGDNRIKMRASRIYINVRSWLSYCGHLRPDGIWRIEIIKTAVFPPLKK